MKLDELRQPNKEITKSYLNYMFKSLRSAQDDLTKDGTPKLNPDDTKKKRAKPLSTGYGELRALRGTPTPDNPLGPIIGSGGEMHSPISPMDAAREISRIKGDMATGQTLPYGSLKDRGDSFDAVTMRNKRSAPGRPAVWPNGAKWDQGGKMYKMNRTVISPDGTRKVTKSRPLKPKETQPVRARSRAEPKLLSPKEKYQFKKQLKQRAARYKLSMKRPERIKKRYVKREPETDFSGKIYLSGTIDENFGKSLDKALGL